MSARRPTADIWSELEWRGARKDEWQAFCDAWGLPRLRERPHRWLEGS